MAGPNRDGPAPSAPQGAEPPRARRTPPGQPSQDPQKLRVTGQFTPAANRSKWGFVDDVAASNPAPQHDRSMPRALPVATPPAQDEQPTQERPRRRTEAANDPH